MLDRRSSHCGALMRDGAPAVLSRPRSPCGRRDSRGPQQQQQHIGNTLGVPQPRSRGVSLPGNMDIGADDIYRLRNFSMAGRKVVNRGDSLKARSNTSINSTGSSIDQRLNSAYSSSLTNSDVDVDFGNYSGNSSRRHSRASRRSSMLPAAAAAAAGAGGSKLMRPAVEVGTGPPPRRYKVTMLGAPGVGKSALTSQFLSSDHMNTYDNVEDDVQKVVSVSVDGRESQMVFVDHAHADMSVENQVSTYDPHGYMVVYAVDDEESLATAERVLNYLKNMEIVHGHAVIIVANKTDLVRSRVVGPSAGKTLAIRYGCKYIETSPGINHNVDELLVGMLAQIELKEEANEKGQLARATNGGTVGGGGGHGQKMGGRVLGFLNKVLDMGGHGNASQTKSCGNLHVL